jgi:hypothetical protein
MTNTYNLYIHYDGPNAEIANHRITRRHRNISRVALNRYIAYYNENYSNVNATVFENVDKSLTSR